MTKNGLAMFDQKISSDADSKRELSLESIEAVELSRDDNRQNDTEVVPVAVERGPSNRLIDLIRGYLDPLFLGVMALSLSVVLVSLIVVYLKHRQMLDRFSARLSMESAALAGYVTTAQTVAVDGVVEDGIENTVVTDAAIGENSRAINEEMISLNVAAPTHADDQSSVGSEENSNLRIVELQAIIDSQSEQIDLLSLENYELRENLEYGGRNTSAKMLGTVEFVDSSDRQPEKTGSLSLGEMIARGYRAYQLHDLGQARHWYTMALQSDPTNRDANLGVAALAVAQGNELLAQDRYRHLLSINERDIFAFSALLAMAGTENLVEQEMLSHLDRAGSTADHSLADLYEVLGHHYSTTRNWDKARKAYETAVLKPTANRYYNLAVSWDRLQQTPQAIKFYQLALNTVDTSATTNGVKAATSIAVFDRSVVQQRVQYLLEH